MPKIKKTKKINQRFTEELTSKRTTKDIETEESTLEDEEDAMSQEHSGEDDEDQMREEEVDEDDEAHMGEYRVDEDDEDDEDHIGEYGVDEDHVGEEEVDEDGDDYLAEDELDDNDEDDEDHIGEYGVDEDHVGEDEVDEDGDDYLAEDELDDDDQVYDKANQSSTRIEKAGINSSKFRSARVVQRRTDTTRNILTVKYKHGDQKAIYIQILSNGLGNTKLTMPHGEGVDNIKRGHTEAILYAIMQDQKIMIPDGFGDYKELPLSNADIEYISSSNEACSGKGSENCKTDIVPLLLKRAVNAQFYYNNPYVAGQETSTATEFKKNTNQHYNRTNDSQEDSEEEADFYAVNEISEDAKDRADETRPLFRAELLKDFVQPSGGVKPFLTQVGRGEDKQSGRDLDDALPWERRKYTRKKKPASYGNEGKSLHKHFNDNDEVYSSE
ncbi:hypothetical protein [Candidatus Amoebophilus asiaticus]|nr:hypothetical protein [Candidatus Amoebophilus asiaticus]